VGDGYALIRLGDDADVFDHKAGTRDFNRPRIQRDVGAISKVVSHTLTFLDFVPSVWVGDIVPPDALGRTQGSVVAFGLNSGVKSFTDSH
jgi:hypothetical protein